MNNFDFHNLLNSIEFEAFCRDILEIREFPLKFTTYKPGRDGGIDFRCTNAEASIIGQAKLYKPDNYKALKATLINEVIKCKRQNPRRYILCISLSLHPPQADEIMHLFAGYIKSEEDILDREKLNKYLGDKAYESLLKTYSKLLIPNASYLEGLLEKIILRKHINSTRRFLKEIEHQHKLFYNTTIFKQCLEKIYKTHVIILTGNPGVGKTTTAKMITQHLLVQKFDSICFSRSLNDVDEIFDENKKQLFVIDDFWGSVFHKENTNRDDLKQFIKIVGDFCNDDRHFLILTSRKYIIQAIINKAEKDVQEILELNNFSIDLDEYSDEDKARIFLNHLLFYNEDRKLLSRLEYNEILEKVVKHRNYSPRHVDFFIKHIHKKNKFSEYEFYDKFLKYLDNPQDFWNDIFQHQSPTSQLILIILLISSDPMEILDLKKSFLALQQLVRDLVNLNIEPLEFENEIRLLEELFVVSEIQEYSSEIWISFQSPGIKDFLLEYIRLNIDSWGEPLIRGAIFFNQLNFVFATDDSKMNDYDSDNPVFGEKIKLPAFLGEKLKFKILAEFDNLNFSTREEREFAGEFTSESTAGETRYWKLRLLSYFFDITQIANEDVRLFIITEVLKDIQSFDQSKLKIVDWKSMLEFPFIIKLLLPYLKIDETKLVEAYHKSITFAREFESFYEFKDLVPETFEKYIQTNIKAIKKQIRTLIIDDTDYFSWHEMDLELDTHLDYTIETVCKLYGIRITKYFINQIEEIAERKMFLFSKPFRSRKVKEERATRKKTKKKKRYTESPLAGIVKGYLYDDDNREINPVKYISTYCSNKALAATLIAEAKKESSVFSPFFRSKHLLTGLVDFLSVGRQRAYNHIYDSINDFFSFLFADNNEDSTRICRLLSELSVESVFDDSYFSEQHIAEQAKEFGLNEFNAGRLYPIIVREKEWFSFESGEFRLYFVTRYILNITSFPEYKDQVEELCNHIYDPLLLKMLIYADPGRVINKVILPELNRFISSVNKTSTHEIVKSVISFFEVNFTLAWNDELKQFDEHSSSHAESFIEILLDSIINAPIDTVDIYFLNDYQIEEKVVGYPIHVEILEELYRAVLNQVPSFEGHRFLDDEIFMCYEIKLPDFLNNENNYEILKRMGFEEYVISVYSKVVYYVNNLHFGEKPA